jgi:hypothetical protein
MKNKILDTIEGSFTLLSLIAVITVSVFTVNALNPVEYVSEQESQVQGIQTQNEELGIPLKVTNVVENNEFITASLIMAQNGRYEMTLNFKSAKQGSNKFSVFKVENLNDFETKLNIKNEIIDLDGNTKVYLEDNLDKIELFSDRQSIDRLLTLKSRSQREITLNVETPENINYPFQIKLYLE